MTAAPQQSGARTEATGIGRWQMPALVVGIIGIVLSVVGWFLNSTEFYQAYLPAFIFWFQIAVGCLGILMLQYVTGGEWGILLRRPLGAGARTMWVMVLFFVPIVVGLKAIYPWANADVVAHDEVLKLKEPYLNATAFVIRAAVYFAIWILWAWRIRVLSLRFYDDRSPDTDLSRRKWAAFGLVLFCLTMTFAGIDWMMSTEPKWVSSMYGITFLISAGLAAYAFVTWFLTRLADKPAMKDVLKPMHFRDLGNLMFAFVLLWAYTAFSEYLLIWYANMKEEIPHFIVRQAGLWGFIALLLVVFHFFLPFAMLLMRAIKDRPGTVGAVAMIILVIRFFAIYWLTEPSFSGAHFHFSWISLAAMAGIGGIWVYLFIGQLKGQSIIPIHETWVEEAIREGALKTNA
jgi:hypothetical protein